MNLELRSGFYDYADKRNNSRKFGQSRRLPIINKHLGVFCLFLSLSQAGRTEARVSIRDKSGMLGNKMETVLSKNYKESVERGGKRWLPEVSGHKV